MIDSEELDFLVEVTLKEQTDFLKVKETLTRIGMANREKKILYQSCHILHKRQKFYIVHFKEMFILDGLETDMTDDDVGRRNTIASLLDEWGLVKIVDKDQVSDPRANMSKIAVIPFKDKANWELVPKYHIGKK